MATSANPITSYYYIKMFFDPSTFVSTQEVNQSAKGDPKAKFRSSLFPFTEVVHITLHISNGDFISNNSSFSKVTRSLTVAELAGGSYPPEPDIQFTIADPSKYTRFHLTYRIDQSCRELLMPYIYTLNSETCLAGSRLNIALKGDKKDIKPTFQMQTPILLGGRFHKQGSPVRRAVISNKIPPLLPTPTEADQNPPAQQTTVPTVDAAANIQLSDV